LNAQAWVDKVFMHRLACPVRGRVDNTEPRVHPVVGVEVRVNVNEREWTLGRRERTQDRERNRVITADRKRARSGGRDLPELGLDVLDRPVGDHELRHDDVAEVAEAAEVVRHDAEAPVAASVASRDVAHRARHTSSCSTSIAKPIHGAGGATERSPRRAHS
jgi:hypothetical protein